MDSADSGGLRSDLGSFAPTFDIVFTNLAPGVFIKSPLSSAYSTPVLYSKQDV